MGTLSTRMLSTKKDQNSRQYKAILIQKDKEEEKHVESNDRKQLELFDVTILTMNFNNIQEIMIYLIGKLNQIPIILTSGQFDVKNCSICKYENVNNK
jgi:hypothetical protein